jgi:hypothetical protein
MAGFGHKQERRSATALFLAKRRNPLIAFAVERGTSLTSVATSHSR